MLVKVKNERLGRDKGGGKRHKGTGEGRDSKALTALAQSQSSCTVYLDPRIGCKDFSI